jgi:hypothetical protein
MSADFLDVGGFRRGFDPLGGPPPTLEVRLVE